MHDLGIEPAALYRELAKDQRCHDTQGCGQHIRRVDCRKPQAVDCKFQDQKLPDQRNIDILLHHDKVKCRRDPVRILHQQQECGCDKIR